MLEGSNETFDKNLYLSIKAWMYNLYITPDYQIVPGALLTTVYDSHYVCIDLNSEGDIDVQHYSDPDHEESIDGGGVCTTDDVHELLDSVQYPMSGKDLHEFTQLLDKKADFIYELCYTG